MRAMASSIGGYSLFFGDLAADDEGSPLSIWNNTRGRWWWSKKREQVLRNNQIQNGIAKCPHYRAGYESLFQIMEDDVSCFE